ncbi:poly(hydroxyalkanoate) granule-associated protein [Alcanivorax hongdengensis A-11-3]|uniref:Poly(Hydroxyalkanoate) granule-associated protein n=1 Tax=Alcanivorax hongdengensis A-11-3 TaxID=1177179 RepID=L0WA68_9GAMM|nr:phasin family protein [Alcanivorax hongdengensis]EKF72967.1 poly(hydroxyalkanoate) granule-associated protein [Alcanivorax hongdengensis A-11-3]
MSEAATLEQRLNARVEQLSADAKAVAEKLNNAVTGAYSRLEENGTSLFEKLVKTGEKRQKAQAKPQKKGAKAEPSQLEAQLDQLRTKLATTLGLPTRDEVEALNKKLTSLTRKVNKLAKEAKAS